MGDGEHKESGADAVEAAAEAAEALKFEQESWVPTSYLAQLLGDDAAIQLSKWAGVTDKSHRVLIRTRAIRLEARDITGVRVGRPQFGRLHWWFWRAEPITSNMVAGTFQRRLDDGRSLEAIGVELNKDDLGSLIHLPADMVATDQPAAKHPGGGRKPEYDWQTMFGALLWKAHIDGLDDLLRKADLERWVADWFSKNGDKSPSASLIRTQVSGYWEAFRALRDKGA